MATTLRDLSQTPESNTTHKGVSILGTASPSTLDNAARAFDSMMADWMAGDEPIWDTAAVCDPVDITKVARLDAEGIPTGTERVLDAEALHDLIETGLGDLGVSFAANHLSGFTLSNNGSDLTNDIDTAAGSCLDSTNTYSIKLSGSITKQLDAAWVVGTNQGGLDTGSIANTTYHVYAIKRLDTGVVDAIFSASASAPTLPANYTIYRRIGSIIRASASIRAFTQFGDEFLLSAPDLDVDVVQGAAAVLRALDFIPAGIRVWAKLRLRGDNASQWGVLVSSPDVPDAAPNLVDAPGVSIGAPGGSGDRNDIDVRTDTSRQIRTRGTGAGINLQIVVYGWIDPRGKN